MKRRCDKCGVVMKEIDENTFFCPNHGTVNIEEDSSDTEERSYIG